MTISRSPIKIFTSLVIACGIALVLFVVIFVYITPVMHTEYAPKYSYWNFRKIKLGMSGQEVTALIGDPFDKEVYKDYRGCIGVPTEELCHPVVYTNHIFWIYSRQDPANTSYFIRTIEFTDGFVSKVNASIYAD